MPILLEEGTDSLKETSQVKGSTECHSEYLRAVGLVLLKNVHKYIHKSKKKKERKKERKKKKGRNMHFRKSAFTFAMIM